MVMYRIVCPHHALILVILSKMTSFDGSPVLQEKRGRFLEPTLLLFSLRKENKPALFPCNRYNNITDGRTGSNTR